MQISRSGRYPRPFLPCRAVLMIPRRVSVCCSAAQVRDGVVALFVLLSTTCARRIRL